MKISHGFVVAAILLAVGISALSSAAAQTGSGPAIFVDNYDYVTAYPVGASGNVAPIAITPDMIYPAGIAQDGGWIFVTNPSTNTVAIYPPDATGNVPPFEIIGGSKTRLANPTGIALDQHGNIYVLNSATATITVYALPGVLFGRVPVLLNLPPIAVIAGPKTKLKQPVALAVDGSGDIYVANQAGGPVVPGQRLRQGTITVYPAGSTGNVAPASTIKGSATGLVYPVSIALDSNRNIYVANIFTYVSHTFVDEPSITVFQAGSAGNTPPSAVIGGTNTGLGVSPIALDSGGNIYATGITSKGNSAINFYPTASNGNVAPKATITGVDSGLNFPSAMTLDSNGSLYVLNGEEVNVYSSGSSGDAAPTNTITSSFTGINGSQGIAVDSQGKIYLANSPRSPDFQGGSLSIFAPGSYATRAPAAVIMGDKTGLNYPRSLTLDAKSNISVLNSDNTITVYPTGSTGNVKPSATINVGGNIDPIGIARGTGGELYVANQGAVECNSNGQNCHQTNFGSINIYPAGANGSAKPSAVISGYETGLASPSAIAVSKRGNIFVANQGPMDCSYGCFPYAGPGRKTVSSVPNPSGNGSITVYAAGSAGNASPIATIQGALTQLGIPEEIAVDSSENIYVVDGGGFVNGGYGGKVGRGGRWGEGFTHQVAFLPPSILVFKAGSNGDTPPSAIIRGPFTALSGSAIAIGPSGQ